MLDEVIRRRWDTEERVARPRLGPAAGLLPRRLPLRRAERDPRDRRPSADRPLGLRTPNAQRETGADRARVSVLVGHDVESVESERREGVDRPVRPGRHQAPAATSRRDAATVCSVERPRPAGPCRRRRRRARAVARTPGRRAGASGASPSARTARPPSSRRRGARTLAAADRPGSPRTPRRRCFGHIAPRRRRARSRATVRRRHGRGQHRRDRTCARAEIDGHPRRWEERRRSSCQRLGLRPRHVDARCDEQPDAAERDRARQPRDRLAVGATDTKSRARPGHRRQPRSARRLPRRRRCSPPQ